MTLDVWSEVFGRSMDADAHFFEVGGASIEAAAIVNRLRLAGASAVDVRTVYEQPTPRRLAAWCAEHDPAAALRRPVPPSLTDDAVDRARALLARRIAPAGLASPYDGPRAERVVFVLSPPRSGSTLLRVMLAGHPALFGPPELYLLGFDTLAARRRSLSGPRAPLARGLVRAMMALDGVGPEEAAASLDRMADEGASTIEAYRRLQARATGRTLVDKTPGYALSPQVLRRMAEGFVEPLFIHLTRHPVASVVSFTRVRIDLSLGTDDELPADPRSRGELWWRIGHENIEAFLDTVPDARVHRMRYEDLVSEPEQHARALCAWMGLPFEPAMVEPYADPAGRMTDGLDGRGGMLGDRAFADHGRIDAALADRWRTYADGVELSAATRALAERLGYPAEDEHAVWTF